MLVLLYKIRFFEKENFTKKSAMKKAQRRPGLSRSALCFVSGFGLHSALRTQVPSLIFRAVFSESVIWTDSPALSS